jgi:hypothetical protein
MYLLDLSTGVSPELLYAALFQLTSPAPSILSELFLGLNRKKPFPFLKDITAFLEKPKTEQDLLKLQNTLASYNSRDCTVYFQALAADAPQVGRFVKQANLKNLDPWSLFIYICIIQLQNKINNKFLVSTPCIGLHSAAEVFEIFKGTRILTSIRAGEISLLCAIFLNIFFTPFTENCEMELNNITEIADPLSPDVTANLFEYHQGKAGGQADTIVVLETNIDDSTPEIIAAAMQHILERGALDFSIIPATMKKGRPGFLIQVLCAPEQCVMIEKLLLQTTSTFGLRRYVTERRILKRELRNFQSSFGEIHVKYGFLDDKCIKAVPEIEDVISLSKSTKIPLHQLYRKIYTEVARQTENIDFW